MMSAGVWLWFPRHQQRRSPHRAEIIIQLNLKPQNECETAPAQRRPRSCQKEKNSQFSFFVGRARKSFWLCGKRSEEGTRRENIGKCENRTQRKIDEVKKVCFFFGVGRSWGEKARAPARVGE